ncbi:MAG TPA: PD-(D/E)XK nuclease family protein [Thermoanaerobaculia bacterium]|nr:PD-(D/E)XK nuclease family protein [Thermoanaerobaculia bacterium]
MLDRLAGLLDEARRDPSLLALPVRIVVPSRSLRAHVAAAVARNRSAAGVLVQNLHGLAFEILERAGEAAPRGLPLSEILAQRHAAKEPSLRSGLGDLVDGYGGVAATARDLVDAGLEPVHADAALEILTVDGPSVASRAAVERARALVRVAVHTEDEMRRRDLGDLGAILRRAADLLETDADRVLPARAVLIHGFADATGVASDLLQSLLRRRQAVLVLDRPPAWQGEGVESAFTERLAGRLAPVAQTEEAPPPPLADVAPPRVERFQAPGTGAETREVARRIRSLLDSGARPEGIGIVGRDLSSYRLPLARHLRRLGVPFSALGTRGALGHTGRRARAFLELLRRGDDVPADRWLDAVASISGVSAVDLRLAFASLGAGRLRDVASLRPDLFLKGEPESYPLPIRHGLREATREGEEADPDEGVKEVHAVRRRVAGERIRSAVRLAGRVRERLAAWPEEARASDHLSRLRALLVQDLGWKDEGPVFEALEALGREIPERFTLDRDELRRLLARELEEAGTAELGGKGGGVQVLSAMEARGRTFEHLFLIGLNRDVFPRGVREDPLLPDDLRRVLQRILPDVPVKLAGFDEERWLFAHLLSASPSVTLSWQSADEDGKALSPSPLLRDLGDVLKVPPLWSREAARQGPRTAAERAVLAALHGQRSGLGRVLPIALAEARLPDPSPPGPLSHPLPTAGRGGTDTGGGAPLPGGGSAMGEGMGVRGLAAARLAILDEIDPDLRTPEGRATRARLGPYYGFVGAVGSLEKDPRRRELYVTHLENLASCPWQLFLQKLLRLEPTPDPLEMAPGADPLLLGNLTHAVLERIVREAGGGQNGMVAVPWPRESDLEEWLLEESVRLLQEDGIFLAGLARALAEQVRPRLDAARETDWAEGPLPVLRVEDEWSLEVLDAEGRTRTVRFRADRVDLLDGGVLRRTDYKTGRPISDKRGEQTRRRHFLEKVRAGTHLQGVAYGLASKESVGRYLFLKPGLEARVFEAGPEDRDLVEAFHSAVRSVLAAWDAGAFFPRVVDPAGRGEPGRCKVCEVAEACMRGDSGARLRLFEWAELLDSSDPQEAALLQVWRLPAKEKEKE